MVAAPVDSIRPTSTAPPSIIVVQRRSGSTSCPIFYPPLHLRANQAATKQSLVASHHNQAAACLIGKSLVIMAGVVRRGVQPHLLILPDNLLFCLVPFSVSLGYLPTFYILDYYYWSPGCNIVAYHHRLNHAWQVRLTIVDRYRIPTPPCCPSTAEEVQVDAIHSSSVRVSDDGTR